MLLIAKDSKRVAWGNAGSGSEQQCVYCVVQGKRKSIHLPLGQAGAHHQRRLHGTHDGKAGSERSDAREELLGLGSVR